MTNTPDRSLIRQTYGRRLHIYHIPWICKIHCHDFLPYLWATGVAFFHSSLKSLVQPNKIMVVSSHLHSNISSLLRLNQRPTQGLTSTMHLLGCRPESMTYTGWLHFLQYVSQIQTKTIGTVYNPFHPEIYNATDYREISLSFAIWRTR